MISAREAIQAQRKQRSQETSPTVIKAQPLLVIPANQRIVVQNPGKNYSTKIQENKQKSELSEQTLDF